MKNILCFGDSNTWGYTPITKKRYPFEIRWTGVLQSKLGCEYRIIEEGLNGRTTVHDDPNRNDRNGIKLLPALIESHSPLDLVIIMLGTNDLKASLQQSALSISLGVKQICETVINSDYFCQKTSKILLISPNFVEDVPEEDKDEFEHAKEMSREFSTHYLKVAQELNIHFFDAAKEVKTSPLDGIHWDAEQHIHFGECLAIKVKSILD